MILRCPFCQTKDQQIVVEDNQRWVQCKFCGARGPKIYALLGEHIALESWNRTYSSQQRIITALYLHEIAPGDI